MKKIVSLLIAVMMISTVAFGATISDATTDYETITVNYSGVASADATVLVYHIEDEEGTPEFDPEKHTIVGINQDTNDGTFTINLGHPDYTGAIVVAIGGDGTVARFRIDVVGGLPESVTEEFDCKGGTVTLKGDAALTIQHLKLLDAYVNNVSGGTITYVNKNGANVDLRGSMYFDSEGTLVPTSSTPVILTLNTGDGKKAVGFMWSDTVAAGGGVYGYTIEGGAAPVYKTFDLTNLSGNFKFAVGVENVPADLTLSLSADGI